MLHLLGVEQPRFEADSLNSALHWSDLIGQTFDGFRLHRMAGTAAEQQTQMGEELRAERPVGLLLRELDLVTGQRVERGWVILRMHEVGPYVFLDAVRRHPDSTADDGRFTERRVLRLDQMMPDQIEALIHCQPLTAPTPYRRRGRPRKRRF